MDEVVPGNSALVRSVVPYEKRDEFLGDLGSGMDIDSLMKKWPFEPSFKQKVRDKLSGLKHRLFDYPPPDCFLSVISLADFNIPISRQGGHREEVRYTGAVNAARVRLEVLENGETHPQVQLAAADYRQDHLLLGGPAQASARLICDGVEYAFSVEQGGGTTSITVESERAVDWDKLLKPLYIPERLLMVFDGAFIRLDNVSYGGSPKGDDRMFESEQVKAKRLSYFTTDNKHFTIRDKLANFQSVF